MEAKEKILSVEPRLVVHSAVTHVFRDPNPPTHLRVRLLQKLPIFGPVFAPGRPRLGTLLPSYGPPLNCPLLKGVEGHFERLEPGLVVHGA